MEIKYYILIQSVLAFCVGLYGVSSADGTNSLERTDETRLIDTIMDDYNSASRPVYNASKIVTVKFGITLTQISDMDEVNQVLTLNVWLEQEWFDERLTWDPKDYNNLKILRIPCEKLWLPDIVLYNSADDFTTGYMNSKAMVRSDGNVFWPPPAKFRSSCTIDITYFPFDDQICELKFGSWTYDGFQVDITNRSAKVDLQNYVMSGEWELIKVGLKRTEVTYACCEVSYPDVRFTIVIRRKTLFYLFNIIFPCLWLTILSLLGFWLPPDSGEKITLGITVLLAFSVFMLLIAESMPATSEFVPLIGIYLTVTMGMTSLSIILTVFVLQLHHVGPHQKPVPGWLRTLVFDLLAKLVCMSYASKAFKKKSRLQNSKESQQLINTAMIASPVCFMSGSEPNRPPASGSEYAHKWQQENYRAGSVYSGSATPNCNGYNTNTTNKPSARGTPAKPGTVHVVEQRKPVQYSAWGSSAVASEGQTYPAHATYTSSVNHGSGSGSSSTATGRHTTGLAGAAAGGGGGGGGIGGFGDVPRGGGGGGGASYNSRTRPDSSSSGGGGGSGGTAYYTHGATRPSMPMGGGGVSSTSSPGPMPEYQWWNSMAMARNSVVVASGHKEADPLEQVEAEWQFLAHVMDRLLFWLFLLVAFVSSLAILVIKPLLKPQSYDMVGLYDAEF